MGTVPSIWKKARIVPVPKSGRSSDPKDYRPISILCYMALVAERFVAEHLQQVTDSELPDFQYGFGRNRGTEDALIMVESAISEAWNVCALAGQATRAAVVSIDTLKAFDTLPHEHIIQSLRGCNGVQPGLVRWFADYLSDRTQCVQVGVATSHPIKVRAGVPQGSVVGPLLFNLAMRRMKGINLTRGTSLVQYADDVILIRALCGTHDQGIMEMDVAKVIDTIESTGLRVNPDKTGYMVATLDRRDRENTTSIEVGGATVQASGSLKYLGVTFDKNLSFRTHIAIKTRQARQKLGHLHSVMRRWRRLRAFQHIYQTCIRPTMTYASVIFSGRQLTGDRMLARVDRIASRMCTNDYSSEAEVVAARLGWTELVATARIRRLATVHAYRLNYRPPPSMVKFKSARRNTRATYQYQCEPPPPTVREGVAMSCLRRGIKDYNELPLAVRQMSHMPSFVKAVTQIHSN